MSTPREQIQELNRQAWAICKKDGPQAIQLARQAQALLADCPEAQPIDEFESLKTQAYGLDMLGHPEEALPLGLRAKQVAEQIGDRYLIGSIGSIIARTYWHIDDFATSMNYYLNALNMIQTEHHPDLEVSLTNGLGLVQYGLENYAEALGYFKTCLEKAAAEDLTGRADANNNVAYVLHVLGRDGEALPYGLAALSLFNQLGTSVGKMETLHSLGAIYFSLQNFDEAMRLLQEGIAIARQTGSQLLELSYIIEICRIHRAQGRLAQAETELLLALETAERISSQTYISLAHERLVEVYKDQHDYQSALTHAEAFHATFKKVFNDKSDRRIKNLEILHQVEISRQQADLYRELAGTDFLTNLVNRRRLLEIAEAAWQRVRTAQDYLAIIMLDVDHFKRVNDQYGHKAGDATLAAVAVCLKKSLRQGDVAGRFGGEEFIVLVLGAPPERCEQVAERLRQAVAQLTITNEPAPVRVTISLGLACLDLEQPKPLDTLIDCADQALLLAKQQGRDRVVVWNAPSAALAT